MTTAVRKERIKKWKLMTEGKAHCSSFLQLAFRTCSSGESERDSAKVEVARSNRARSTNFKNSYGVAELERRESLKLVYVGSNPTSVASLKS